MIAGFWSAARRLDICASCPRTACHGVFRHRSTGRPVGVAAWCAKEETYAVRFATADELGWVGETHEGIEYTRVSIMGGHLADWLREKAMPYHPLQAVPWHDSWWIHVEKLFDNGIAFSIEFHVEHARTIEALVDELFGEIVMHQNVGRCPSVVYYDRRRGTRHVECCRAVIEQHVYPSTWNDGTRIDGRTFTRRGCYDVVHVANPGTWGCASGKGSLACRS